ncbi:MAG: protein translocase subunit SecF, partial [candidate division WOR-3 bacterium]
TYIISGALFVFSVALFLIKGLNLGIDFTGGTLIQVHVERGASISQMRAAATSAGLSKAEIQSFGEAGEFVIKYQENKNPDDVVKAMETSLGSPIRLDRNEQVGPRIGAELREQAIIALGIGLLLMLIYIWIRFNFWFGLASIIALFHDVIITMGIYTLLGFEVTSATVAAVLTIVGYSINDSIVISDRIREMLKGEEKERLDYRRMLAIFNEAVNATLSRTVLTGGTTLMVLVGILVLAGPMIFDFALALTVGIIVGTYSSIFIVAALVLDWTGKRKPKPEKA